jgi:3D (Asp-Asp-Asp) domain-containing protein
MIPIGTKIYIKDFDGMKLPDGQVHDGWWIAADRGGRIKHSNGSGRRGSQLDLFVGHEHNKEYLFEHGFSGKETVNIKVLK